MNPVSLLFSFKGRTTRTVFWAVTLALAAWSVVFDQIIGPIGPDRPMTIGQGIVVLLNFILATWIGLAVQIKRWHDLDKSGWWAMLSLVPIIGWIWILVECGFFEGTPGTNRYGDKP